MNSRSRSLIAVAAAVFVSVLLMDLVATLATASGALGTGGTVFRLGLIGLGVALVIAMARK